MNIADIQTKPAPDWLIPFLKPKEHETSSSGTNGAQPSLNGNHAHANGDNRANAYAQKAFDDEIALLSSSPSGERNQQLFKTTANLWEFVNSGALDSSEVEHRVLEACRANGLLRDDGETAVRKSFESAKRRVGSKARDVPQSKKKPVLRGRKARSFIQGASGESVVEETGESDNEDNFQDSDDNPYAIQDGRIMYALEKNTKQGKDTSFNVVCDFVAHIVEEIIPEEGNGAYRIRGRAKRGGAFEFEISVDDFADERRLRARLEAMSGPQSPIRAGMSKHVGAAIKLLTGRELTRTMSYERTGWADDSFLIPGREYANAVVHVSDPPYAINPDASLQDGLECLETLLRVQSLPMTTVAATVAFQAPLAHLCGWRNERYGLFITGQTGSFKSSWAQVLMAMYGADFMDDSNLLKWGEGSSRNAIGRIATLAHDLPLMIDNYKPNTGRGSEDFVTIMHNILEGAEKRRMNQFQKLVGKRPIYCWPIITGEDVPDVDAAALARVLVIPFPVPDEDNDTPLLTRAQELAPHLCAVGREWLIWLESDAGRDVAQRVTRMFGDARNQWRERLRTSRAKIANPFRMATNLATNDLTWWAMSQCPFLTALTAKYSAIHNEGLESVSGAMANQTSEAMEANRFLSVLREQLATGRCLLLPYHQRPTETERDRVIGWWDKENQNVLLQRDSSVMAVKRVIGHEGLNKLSNAALYKQLANIGALAKSSEGKLTFKARAGGVLDNFLCVRGELLSDEEGGESDE